MASSTDTESCSAPSSPMNYEILWPHLSPQICYNTLMPPSVDLDCFQPRTRLEADAKKALSQGMVLGEILARLTEELPSSLRAVHGDPPFGSRLLPRAFNAGAYIHGPHSGLHGTTMEYEIPVLLLTSVVRGMRPNFTFSTVSLLRNVRAALHRDSHNHAAASDLVLPLTQFTGGEVFVEDSSGTSIQGNPPIAGMVFPLLCDQEPTPVEFNPRLLHCTLPWVARGLSWWHSTSGTLKCCRHKPRNSGSRWAFHCGKSDLWQKELLLRMVYVCLRQ